MCATLSAINRRSILHDNGRAGATLADRARRPEPHRASRRKPGSSRHCGRRRHRDARGRGRHGRPCRWRARSRSGHARDAQRVLGDEPAAVRPGGLPAPHRGPRTRSRRRPRPGPAPGNPSACHLRALPGAGLERVLGARRRQPHLPAAPRQGVRSHARSQPRRTAGAGGPHHRAPGAGASHAQLRRMLHRRRSRPAGDDAERPPRTGARRRAHALFRRAVVGARGRTARFAQHESSASICAKRWSRSASRPFPIPRPTRTIRRLLPSAGSAREEVGK